MELFGATGVVLHYTVSLFVHNILRAHCLLADTDVQSGTTQRIHTITDIAVGLAKGAADRSSAIFVNNVP